MIYIHLLIMVMSCATMILSFISSLFTEDENDYKAAVVSLLVCVISMVFFFVGTQKCGKAEWIIDDEPYAVESIVALNDNNMTNGRIYLRRGYIEEDLYYQYIVELRGGGFKANKVKSSNAVLFYDEDNYRVEWYKQTKGWLYFKQERIYHKIYIPEGSLTSDYLVDLN